MEDKGEYPGNVIQFPLPERDPLLDSGEVPDVIAVDEAVDEAVLNPDAQKPDVLGLVSGAIWEIAGTSGVSRGKVRRVLKAFEPLFWYRLDEAYQHGAQAGAQSVVAQLQSMSEGTDESSDDTPETTGREEGVSPEA